MLQARNVGCAQIGSPRVKISMMIIAAPQSGQTKWAGPGLPSLEAVVDSGARALDNVQQFTCPVEMLAAPGIGKQPIVADAMKAAGQHVQQEAAHELVRIERHGLVTRLPLAR